jgi:quaternary ammonium compound-resistance protein SugE
VGQKGSVAWILLVIAGLLEAGWAIGLKYTDGFTRIVPSVLTAAAIVGSMILLSLAVRTVPIGAAYAVWVGVGVAAAAVLGILLLGEQPSVARIGFLVLLLISVAGLLLTSAS